MPVVASQAPIQAIAIISNSAAMRAHAIKILSSREASDFVSAVSCDGQATILPTPISRPDHQFQAQSIKYPGALDDHQIARPRLIEARQIKQGPRFSHEKCEPVHTFMAGTY